MDGIAVCKMKTSYPIKHPCDTGHKNWAINAIEEQFPTFCDNISTLDEIIYSKKLKIFRDSKILLVGGGPSSFDFNSDKFYEYDYVWSMNNFFMNSKLYDFRISLAMFGANTRLNDLKLNTYILRHQPYLVFETHPKYSNQITEGHKKFPDWKKARKLINDIKFASVELKAVCQTSYWSRVGIGARMMILAGYLGVKSLDFVGIDGYSSYNKGKHFFEENKGCEALPSSIKDMNNDEAKDVFLNEYKILRDILRNFTTKYKNLALNYILNDIGTLLDQ